MARGTGGLAPAVPPIQLQPPSIDQGHSGHRDTTGWQRQITHRRTCTSSHKLQQKVTAWVRGLVLTGLLKIIYSIIIIENKISSNSALIVTESVIGN